MEKVYDPSDIESKLIQTWEQSGCNRPEDSDEKDSYCIMIPPPNVTGSLHMGHAFQDTIMDALIRYNKMSGKNTLWQVGTDHAGIATQMVVERKLNKENLTKYDLGREKFIDKIWEWKEESGGTILKQLRRLGCSCDWERERFTMDKELSLAVTKTFVSLYREGLIYRGSRLVNWDPVLNTAISDLEVLSVDENGSLWHISYPIDGTDDNVVIATTRPETMFGDQAIAVHPEDERYKHLVGKNAVIPVSGRKIPIITDEYVEKDFGTGCVKITPAHDFNDYEMGKRHDLPLMNIMNKDATLNEEVPANYIGLDRFDARKKLIKELEETGNLIEIEPHKLKVPKGDRSNSVIEPLLTDQWFVSMKELAKPAIDAVSRKEIEFVPNNWEKTYFEWLNNIQDWCISRQLWWGHRIPAWYDENGNIYVGYNEDEVRAHYKLANNLELTRDDDVLDTWFSSALWPFSTLGWPEKTVDFERFFPTNTLVTGFDIIFFWVARMIMFSLKLTGKIPFKTVYIHGLIQDQNGQKMSKSKGNVIDPLDLIDGISLEDLIAKRTSGLMQPKMRDKIEKQTRKDFANGIAAYGTDALRFTYMSLATNGRHLRFELNRLEGYRNFCNKIWNAARYIEMKVQGIQETKTPKIGYAEEWIMSLWQDVKYKIETYFKEYRFDLVSKTIYEFTWNEFCDWYLELSKPVLNGDDADAKSGVKYVLLEVFKEMLQVMHPIMPFITQEIYQKLLNNDTLLVDSVYPVKDESLVSENSAKAVEIIKSIILGVRNIRGEMNISPKKEVVVYILAKDLTKYAEIKKTKSLLTQVGNISEILFIESDESLEMCATSVVDGHNILVPIAGLIDLDKEKSRLEKEIGKLDKEIVRAEKKLSNEKYVANAPREIVKKEKNKLADLSAAKAKLELSLDKINNS